MAEDGLIWTSQQEQAIRAVGSGLVVSAAAGAGKTAVLAERCAHLVAERGCPIDRLLVVTFTDAAAAEMRQRIAEALRGRLASRPRDRRVQRQLALIDAASISTIHAFCLDLLRRHFAEAGLDPNFVVIDADEAELLRQEVLEGLFSDLYADGSWLGEGFRGLVELYGQGSDREVGRFVLAVYELLVSLAWPGRWLARARRWGQAGVDRLEGLRWRWLVAELRRQRDHCRGELAFLRRALPEAISQAERLERYVLQLEDWLGRLGGGRQASEEVCEAIRGYRFGSAGGGGRGGGRSQASAEQRKAANAILGDVAERFLERRLKEGPAALSKQEAAEGLNLVGPHVGVLCGLVERFWQRYERAKQDVAAVDFDDLQQRCLGLLSRDRAGLVPSQIARRLQERYEHVLVDEYQDINPVQDAILRLVSRAGCNDRANNLFVVGDVKQSIYRFRQAEPRIFTRAERNCRAGEGSRTRLVRLQENFRSRAGLLEAVNLIFERLMSESFGGVRYDAGARLVAGLRYPSPDGAKAAVELHVLDDLSGVERSDEAAGEDSALSLERIEREAYLAGQRILELTGQAGAAPATIYEPQGRGGTLRARPIRYRDIAVLLRTVRYSANYFAAMLRRMGIPVYAELATGYFDSVEVQDVLSLLRLLDNQQQDIPLAAVLRSPLMGRPLSDSDLVEIRCLDRQVPFHQVVRRYGREGPDVGLRVRLAELLEQLRRWRELGRRRPVAELLARIYQETGYLEYVGGMPEGVQRRANLLKLHERARQFGQFAHQGLFRFLRFIEQLQQRQYDMGSAPPLSEAQDVVRIMSIHRSKGLEFPVVIVAELGKRFNLRDVQGAMLVDRRAYLGLRAIDADRRISYPTLPYQLVRQEIIRQRLAEELRVLYVALTRARERLILIGTASLGQVERWRQRWAGQESGLSELQLLAGRCALDWLVPALACQSDRQVIWSNRDRPEAGQRGVVSIHCHDPEAIGSWREPEGQVELGREGLEPFSRLEPVGQVGPADEVVARTISRLHSSYRHERLTDLPAVVSVSELKRRFVRLAEPDERVASYLLPAWTAERPRFLGGGRGEAGERGSATHLFLQHVELARACDRRDLARQLERAVAEGLLSQEQRQMVDLEGLVWFFGTELGRRLRGAGRRVRRELPFVAGLSPDRYDSGLAGGRFDPADRILLRGIIDCVMVEDGRIEVIDYKTDRVGDDELGGRIELYRPQVQLYGRAIAEIWGMPVVGCWLVFLSARHIEAVEPGL